MVDLGRSKRSLGRKGIEISLQIGSSSFAPVSSPPGLKSFLVPFRVKWETQKLHFPQQPSGVLC